MKILRLMLLVIAGNLAALPTGASFLEPTSCVSLTDEERLAEADLAGNGEITGVECMCDADATCIKTILFSKPVKGQPGQTISYRESLTLDFGVNAEYCKQREQGAKTMIGSSDFYYFKNGELIPPRRCAD